MARGREGALRGRALSGQRQVDLQTYSLVGLMSSMLDDFLNSSPYRLAGLVCKPHGRLCAIGLPVSA